MNETLKVDIKTEPSNDLCNEFYEDFKYQNESSAKKCGEVYWCPIKNNYKFVCIECPEEFNLGECLIGHYENCHSFAKEGQNQLKNETDDFLLIKCDECLKEFTNRKSLTVHVENCHSFAKKAQNQLKNETDDFLLIKCDKCLQEFTSRKLLTTHVENSHSFAKEAQYQLKTETDDFLLKKCDECLKEFTSRKLLTAHIARFHSVQTTKPVDEDTITPTEKSLRTKNAKSKTTSKTSSVAKDQNMDECLARCHSVQTTKSADEDTITPTEKSPRTKNAKIKTASKTSSVAKDQNMDECLKSIALKQLQSLSHRKRQDYKDFSMEELKIPCKYCGRNFELRKQLYSHHKYCQLRKSVKKIKQKMQQNTECFECKFCKKPFENSEEQVSHEKTHLGPKFYKCKFCDDIFRNIRSLNNHQNESHGKNKTSVPMSVDLVGIFGL